MSDNLLNSWLENSNGRQRRVAALLAGLVAAAIWLAFVLRPQAQDSNIDVNQGAIPATLRIAVNNRNWQQNDSPGTATFFNLSLARHLAEQHGSRIEFIETATREQSLQLLRDSAVNLVFSEQIEPDVYPHPGLRAIAVDEVSLLLVGIQGPSTAPLSAAELQNKTIAVVQHSGIASVMQRYKERWPGIELIEVENRSPGELLDMVMTTQVQYAVVRSNDFLTLQHFFPDLIAKYEFSGIYPIAWLANSEDPVFVSAIEQFLRTAKAQGLHTELADANHGHMWNFNYSEATTYLERVESVLPAYEMSFKRAAEQYDLDWRLIAAMAHQESHWDPEATSPTGVRGMMMLTRETAEEMGVENRLDATASIDGGARYLRRMMDLLPDDVAQPDRTWIALASYNVGRGHLLDAQKITRDLGGDPDRWQHLRRYLPLLSDPLWYENTTYGVARGREPVVYVDNVRRYYDMLVWITRHRDSGSVS